MPKDNSKNENSPQAVILTALGVEFNAVKEHLNKVKEAIHPKGNVYEKGLFGGQYHSWSVGIAEIGAGNNTCAMETERAIEFFKPQIILFVGIAGGIKGVSLGDVVAVDKAYGYESGKTTQAGFMTRPEVGKSSYAILSRARAEARKDGWKNRIKNNTDKNKPSILIKPIAAGEKVITEVRSDVYRLIHTHYNDTVAVEMEGSGFYTACHANEGLQFLIVRGISDMLKDKEETDKLGYQEIAAKNASAFAFEVLYKYKIN